MKGTIVAVEPWQFTDDKTGEVKSGQTVTFGYADWQSVKISCPPETFDPDDTGKLVEIPVLIPVPDTQYGKETKLKYDEEQADV